jgi:uncharacterized protein (TIGR02001 family)
LASLSKTRGLDSTRFSFAGRLLTGGGHGTAKGSGKKIGEPASAVDKIPPVTRYPAFADRKDMFPRHPWIPLAALAFSLPAGADFKASATFASDYVYRGYSKSRGNPVLQGNLDYGHESGVYGGFWVSQVGFDDRGYEDRAEVELNPYLGWATELAKDWRLDLSAGRYVYAGKVYGRNSDYNEFYTSLHYRDLVTARVAFAYDAYNRKATTFAYELLARYSVLDTLQLSAGLGFNQASQLLGYNNFYWNAGLTWYAHRYVSVDLRYVDSDTGNHGSGYTHGYFSPRGLEQHYLFSLSMGF